MSSALVLAEQKVPRYTSYPTAPHFTAAIGPDTYAQWLAALPEAATLSLYIHVPYCKELCLYCGCHTKMVRRPEPLQAYARRLAGEIALVARTLAGCKVVHIHWGGGTPSILGPGALIELSANIAERFDLTQIREYAIELDPRRIDPALAQALAQIGFNRVSLGIQDFAPQVQEAIGRVQPFETVTRRADAARGRHRRHEFRPDVRPAAADGARRPGELRYRPGASRSSVMRMCPGSSRTSA